MDWESIPRRLKSDYICHFSQVQCNIYSNGRGEQNKNWNMIGMLSKWLVSDAPGNVKKVWLAFPVVGQLFSPPDRIFVHLEKQTWKICKILNPEIFRKFVTVIPLINIPVLNWKHYSEGTLKDKRSGLFEFQKTKVIEVE